MKGDPAYFGGVQQATLPENELDKQIAAIALIHDLTVVTRNVAHFDSTNVRLLDPFSRD